MGKLFEVAKKQQARIILASDRLEPHTRDYGDAINVLEHEAGLLPSSFKRQLQPGACSLDLHDPSTMRALQLRQAEQK